MLGPEFASVLLKLGRAEEHFNSLEAEFYEWTRSNPYTLVKKGNADGSRYGVHLVINKPPQLDRWSLLAGDCIHSLRSALDHLVYALAVRDTGKNPPPSARSLQFPVFLTSSDYADKAQ